MTNVYRTPAEDTGLNWSKQFRGFYAERGQDYADGFAEHLDKRDKWVPEVVIAQLTDSNLAELFAASDRLQKMSLKNSFYSYYKRIIDKAILLLIESNPESFDLLSFSQKEKVFGTKISVPDEDQFYGQVYAILEDPSALAGSGTFYTGQTFENILGRLVKEEKVLSQKMAEILELFDAHYTLFYSRRAEKNRQMKK